MARRWQIALPMPPDPPVTNAIRLVMLPSQESATVAVRLRGILHGARWQGGNAVDVERIHGTLQERIGP
jgi:hypothetical protein